MLRGIDGVHTWTSPDAVTLRLNELDDVSTGAPKWPRYRLLDVDHGYPEAGATAHKRIGQAGAVAHPDYRGSRIHTYTIEVMGRTIDELRQAEEDLEAAFYDQSAEGRMDVGTHPLNPDYSAANDRYFNAKAGNLIPGTDAPDSDLSPELGFRREWVVDMRNHEGVYCKDVTLAGTASDPAYTPLFTYPVNVSGLDGLTVTLFRPAAAAFTAATLVAFTGYTPPDPRVLKITGAPSSTSMVVDFAARTIVNNSGTDLTPYIVAASLPGTLEWWDQDDILPRHAEGADWQLQADLTPTGSGDGDLEAELRYAWI